MKQSTHTLQLAIAGLLFSLPFTVSGQSVQPGTGLLPSAESQSSSQETLISPRFYRLENRNIDALGIQSMIPQEPETYTIGVELKPLEGLQISADAWKVDGSDMSNGQQVDSVSGNWVMGLQSQSMDEGTTPAAFSLDRPFNSASVRSNGIDLGAAYRWDSDTIGQFTLKTSASYVYDFNRAAGLTDQAAPMDFQLMDLVSEPELAGSLTLTWQFGNHSAKAATNYFDSFKNISELNIEEINELVDSITTVDLQYGYTMKTGDQGRAIISFGIRNLFDKKPGQPLNQNNRVIEQNGRVAYGSFKYQF